MLFAVAEMALTALPPDLADCLSRVNGIHLVSLTLPLDEWQNLWPSRVAHCFKSNLAACW
jgi:hypothetical protein